MAEESVPTEGQVKRPRDETIQSSQYTVPRELIEELRVSIHKARSSDNFMGAYEKAGEVPVPVAPQQAAEVVYAPPANVEDIDFDAPPYVPTHNDRQASTYNINEDIIQIEMSIDPNGLSPQAVINEITAVSNGLQGATIHSGTISIIGSRKMTEAERKQKADSDRAKIQRDRRSALAAVQSHLQRYPDIIDDTVKFAQEIREGKKPTIRAQGVKINKGAVPKYRVRGQ